MTALPNLPRHAMIARAVSLLHERSDTSLVLWTGMARALSKIIGDAGFDSLFFRSLYQIEARYSWIDTSNLGTIGAMDHLSTLLATRDPEESEQVSTELLIVFTDTLNLLIGELVVNRILLAAWGTLAVHEAPESPK